MQTVKCCFINKIIPITAIWFTVALSFSNRAWATDVPIIAGNTIIGQKSVESYWDIKTKGIVMQKLDYSCGSAALATIFTYYLDKKTTENNIINYLLNHGDLKAIIKRRGFSLLDLKEYTQYRGLTAQGYRMNMESLFDMKVPVLLPLVINGYRHFVVYTGHKDDRVFLLDPTFGSVTMLTDEFKKAWYAYENVGLIITKNGYQHSKNIMPLIIFKERKIYVRNSLMTNIINRTIPFFHYNPLEW